LKTADDAGAGLQASAQGTTQLPVWRWHAHTAAAQTPPVQEADCVAQETPIALEYNGISHATVLASPCDIEDLALGFSLTEGIIRMPSDLYAIHIEQTEQGLIAQLDIASACMAQLKQRRRTLAGRTGCGLCGLESLADVVRPLPPVAAPAQTISPFSIMQAMHALREHQPLHQQTGATHAAAWADMSGTLLLVREDVGRHNALDKLIGALVRQQEAGEKAGKKTGENTKNGFAVISSRASFEMVQKAASVGIAAIAAVSAPTHYAIQTAQQLGVLLMGFARPTGFTAYAHAQYLS